MDLTVPQAILPVLICFARIVDVSLGTLRTVAVVRGRVVLASVLGFFEVSIWVLAISGVMRTLDNPLNVLGYALGFALGNAVGISIDRRLALGTIVMRVITRRRGPELVSSLRDRGLRVTEFEGRGRDGPVTMLFTLLERVDARAAQALAEQVDPDCFIVFEDPRGANRTLLPTLIPPTGWRAVMKKK